MPDYKLHCFAQSGHSYKSALLLELSGADWEPVFVDFFKGGGRTPEFRAINAMGECPVLEVCSGDDAGLILTQSGVINDYLVSKTGRYGPASEAERREILRWTLWENHKLNSFLGIWRFMLNFAPKDKVDPAVLGFLKGRVTGAVAVLEAHLANRDWIAAERATVADIACAGYLFFDASEYDWGGDTYPNIEAWKARVAALPGFKHAYDLMPGHPLSV